MKKCLLFLGVLSLAFTAGSALRCYDCFGDDCKDPYSGNSSHVVTCPLLYTHCAKLDVDNGDRFLRGCLPLPVSSSTENKKFQEFLAGRQNNDAVLHFCNAADLCNGSGRLAEISTMMILLPASLVLLISYFSRL